MNGFTLKTTTVAFGVALAILVAIGAWTYRAMSNMVAVERQVAHSHEVLAVLGGDLLTDLLEAQSARRGFVMSEDPRELERHQAAVNSLEGDIARLARLTADRPGQRARVELLEVLVAKRIASWKENVARRIAEGFQIEREREAMRLGWALNHAIRQVVDEMRGEEDSLRRRYKRRARTSVDRAMLLLVSGTLVSIALLATVFALLRGEIGRRARAEAELQLRKGELEAANQELAAFSYSASHDLRSPLAVIDGFGEMLLAEYGDALGEIGCGYLHRVRAVAGEMRKLIDDLLQFSLAQRAELRRETVELSVLAEELIAEMRQVEPSREVTAVIAPEVTAIGDTGLLRVVLRNLLSNAWKFTTKQSQPRIEFGSVPSGGTKAYFVRDNGVGFDMKHAGKVFTAFQRLDNVRDFPGTGIGLATVQRIVQRHGGRVWAEASLEDGATFFFTLRRGVTNRRAAS